MSSERKALKIVCFLYVLDALAGLVTGGIVLAGMGLIDPSAVAVVGGIEFALQPWALAFGVFLLASSIFYLALSMAGIKGANNPHKIGTFRVLAVVALVVSVIGLGINVVFSSESFSSASITPFVSVIFAVLCVILGGKVAKQAER